MDALVPREARARNNPIDEDLIAAESPGMRS
jgi:hypothetical protein